MGIFLGGGIILPVTGIDWMVVGMGQKVES